MCGIVGVIDAGSASGPIGETLLGMLSALACRGPDSSGVAVWGEATDGLVVRVKLGDTENAVELRRREAVHRAGRLGRVRAATLEGSLLGLVVAKADPVELAAAIEAISPDVEVVSVGRRLEILKQVGAPANLEAEFAGAPTCLRISRDRKSTRLNSSHLGISYAVFCLKKKK